jgi:hypothetical protein
VTCSRAILDSIVEGWSLLSTPARVGVVLFELAFLVKVAILVGLLT